jgi:hypothetical protein
MIDQEKKNKAKENFTKFALTRGEIISAVVSGNEGRLADIQVALHVAQGGNHGFDNFLQALLEVLEIN